MKWLVAGPASRKVWSLTTLLGLQALASAAGAQNIASCRGIGDASARLACYDAIAAATAAVPPRDTIVKADEVVTPSAPADFRTPNLRQIAEAPASFVNRPLLFRKVRCVYENVNDYRCRLQGAEIGEIRASIIVPPPAQTAVEAQCGTLLKDRKLICEGDARVIPTAVRSDPDGIIVIETPSITFEIAGRR